MSLMTACINRKALDLTAKKNLLKKRKEKGFIFALNFIKKEKSAQNIPEQIRKIVKLNRIESYHEPVMFKLHKKLFFH